MQVVNIMFKEPVHQIIEKIKVESYFKWPNKKGGDPMKHNQGLYCQYHRIVGTPPNIVELSVITWSNW